MKKEYRKAVFILAYKKQDNKVLYLLLKRKLHWTGWEFPKGGVENKESILNAVKRELYEETHLIPTKIISYKINGKYKYHKLLKDRPGFTGQTYQLFSAEVKPGIIRLDKKEHSAYKWLYYNKAMKALKWQNQRKCLRIVNTHLNKKK